MNATTLATPSHQKGTEIYVVSWRARLMAIAMRGMVGLANQTFGISVLYVTLCTGYV